MFTEKLTGVPVVRFVIMSKINRLRIFIQGTVQGVGFRPFVYRLANELRLNGWVNNSPQGVTIEVEGKPSHLQEFLLRLQKEAPPRASIYSMEPVFLEALGFTEFEILESETRGEKTALILPDIATCKDCLSEIFDPQNRRYLYPFTNCTNCGPRFTIIESLPYDRSNTTMKRFAMCPQCSEEYHNPSNRRFHAQPNACPACGPQIELWDASGAVLARRHSALLQAAEAIRKGKTVAVKGLGGFHLMVDARNSQAVQTLRASKHREEKPFALMFPHIAMVRHVCQVSALEERLLLSPESPIVLLRRRDASAERNSATIEICEAVAPHNPYLGIMLPYTPLHHILLNELRIPVVATSGNLSDEPICTRNEQALEKLGGIADLFLMHDRPIARHADDSIVRITAAREMVLRRARGYVPLPVRVKKPLPSLVAVGGHLKNTIAVSSGNHIFVSQHIGDLETESAFTAFQKAIQDFTELYEVKAQALAGDKHPDYMSTRFGRSQPLPFYEIQHHYAHILACMAENELAAPLLGVSWDGTGYGMDGTIWGGEFLLVTENSFRRVAYFKPFPLPGGEQAIREPRRTALGLLYSLKQKLHPYRDLPPFQKFGSTEIALITTMLDRGINSPLTSSAGRLFDAVASLSGLRQFNAFEGQAAMELEFSLPASKHRKRYPFHIEEKASAGQAICIIDWEPLLKRIISDVREDVPVQDVSLKFHNTMVAIIIKIAVRTGLPKVVLSGGCFQNHYLTEKTISALNRAGFQPHWHQRIPPNDGGISVGQIIGAARQMG